MSDHTHYVPSHTHSISDHSHSFSDWSQVYGAINISGTPVYTDRNAPRGMLYGIGGSIYTHPSTLDGLTKRKDPEMTTLEKVRRERQEARERLRIEQMYTDYDAADLANLVPGTVVKFTWQPKDRDAHEYLYAALFVADKWYVTGRESPNGLATEDFVAWLIGKDVTADDLSFMVGTDER